MEDPQEGVLVVTASQDSQASQHPAPFKALGLGEVISEGKHWR